MQPSQIAGFATTIAVVMAVDLPIDWLVTVAMLSGGVAMFAVEYFLRTRR